MKRRSFLRRTAAGAAGVLIVPRHVLGGPGFIPPSDRLNIAAIGAGGKGWVNITNSWNGGTDNIVALVDVDERMVQEAREKWPEAHFYHDYRVMLDQEKDAIDAVIVSTPDHVHTVQAHAAMELGKHVYCEKPLTHDISEARRLTEAARQYGVVTQMGNQGSSGDSTRLIETWIQDGVIGDVSRVHIWTNRPVWPQGIPTPTEAEPVPPELSWDLWLGTAPVRGFNSVYLPATWRGWVDFGTGSLGDMGCHFIDVPFRALQLGYPVSVEASLGAVWSGFFDEAYYPDSYPPSSKIHIQFPARGDMPEVELIWYDGGIQPERPEELLPDEPMGEWDGGMIFEGSRGKLMAGLFGHNPTLLPTRRMQEGELPESKYPFVEGGEEGHQQQWVRAAKEGYGAYTSSGFDTAGPLTETVLMGNLAIYSHMHRRREGDEYVYEGRKKLLWDGENMRVTNFEPANHFVKREYRTGW